MRASSFNRCARNVFGFQVFPEVAVPADQSVLRAACDIKQLKLRCRLGVESWKCLGKMDGSIVPRGPSGAPGAGAGAADWRITKALLIPAPYENLSMWFSPA